MTNFKENFDAAVGMVSSKISSFVSTQKEKVATYLDGKEQLYYVKSALDEANTLVDALFMELGKTTYYGPSEANRNIGDITNDLKAAIENVQKLEAQYAELRTPATDADADADVNVDTPVCPNCGKTCDVHAKFCSDCGEKIGD